MDHTKGGASAAGARKQLEAFAALIERTARELSSAVAPAQLAAAADAVLADWERVDADFAGVLRDLKGQAWAMQPDHLRAVREKVVRHLEANLESVRRQL